MDAKAKGSLMHAVFEKLSVEPVRLEWSTEELTRLWKNVGESDSCRWEMSAFGRRRANAM